LPGPLKTRIKRADHASAYLEAVQLAGFDEAEAARFFGRPRLSEPIRLFPGRPDTVKCAFLDRFAALSAALAA
jgi:hypothetical protein